MYVVKTIWAGGITNITVQNESTVISALIPGTNYSFSVTVILPDSTEGKEICTHQYTSKSSSFVLVSFLKAELPITDALLNTNRA